jgi:hypothetical protein
MSRAGAHVIPGTVSLSELRRAWKFNVAPRVHEADLPPCNPQRAHLGAHSAQPANGSAGKSRSRISASASRRRISQIIPPQENHRSYPDRSRDSPSPRGRPHDATKYHGSHRSFARSSAGS